MITVPTRVKDALKSGQYKKEYNIIIQDEYRWENVGTYTLNEQNTLIFTAEQTASYKFYVESPSSFSSISYIDNSDVYPVQRSSIGIYDPDTGETSVIIDIAAGFDYSINFIDCTTPDINVEKNNYYLSNENLVYESVKIDERMCSGTELKFGLCEGSSIEFQYFGLSESIFGRDIKVYLRVQYKAENGSMRWNTIPMGTFTVTQCSQQASTGIYKVTAYNRLRSGLLDTDIRPQLIEYLSGNQSKSLYQILEHFLDGIGIDKQTDAPVKVTINVPSTLSEVFGIGLARAEIFHYPDEEQDPYAERVITGEKVCIYYAKFTFTASGWPSDKFYRFILSTWPFTSEITSHFIESINALSDTRVWVGPETGTSTGGVSYAASLTDYMDGEYAYSKYFHGFYRITSDGTAHEYSVYPYYRYYNVDYLTDLPTDEGGNVKFELFIPSYARVRSGIVEDDSVNKPASLDITSTITESMVSSIASRTIPGSIATNDIRMYCGLNTSSVDTIQLSQSEIAAMGGSITIRDLQSASYELECQYGKLDRVSNQFSGISLNRGFLVPQEDLYPDDTLYPAGATEGGYPAMYSKLWSESNNVKTFRYLKVKFKTTEVIDGQTTIIEKEIQRTVNADGNADYSLTDNWLLKNLLWTTSDVEELADNMAEKMRNISWFPFEMWCAGLPYLEAGDQIEIWAEDGVHSSYVLNRTMSGIQNLQDTMINGNLDIF